MVGTERLARLVHAGARESDGDREQGEPILIIRGDIWTLARTNGILTQRQLKVLELRELHGCTWNQIAYMTNTDQSTVRGHYQRAQRRLAHALENPTPGPAL